MSRKPKEVIEEVTENWSTYSICETVSYYGIMYKGKPFMYKSTSMLKEGIRYMPTTYSSLVIATNSCKKLNKRFRTEFFTIVELL